MNQRPLPARNTKPQPVEAPPHQTRQGCRTVSTPHPPARAATPMRDRLTQAAATAQAWNDVHAHIGSFADAHTTL